jgi:hypothetical protein
MQDTAVMICDVFELQWKLNEWIASHSDRRIEQVSICHYDGNPDAMISNVLALIIHSPK